MPMKTVFVKMNWCNTQRLLSRYGLWNGCHVIFNSFPTSSHMTCELEVTFLEENLQDLLWRSVYMRVSHTISCSLVRISFQWVGSSSVLWTTLSISYGACHVMSQTTVPCFVPSVTSNQLWHTRCPEAPFHLQICMHTVPGVLAKQKRNLDTDEFVKFVHLCL